MVRSCFAISFLLATWAPARALAQTVPSLDLRTWRPSSDPAAGIVLEPAVTPGPWQWNIGVWVNYAHSPVVLRDAMTSAIVMRPVAHALGTDLVAGLGLGDRAAVGVDLPLSIWQDGTSSLRPTIVRNGSVPSTGLGDIAVLGKATALSNDRQGVRAGFGLAALGGITLPSGDRANFMSESSVTMSLVALCEYALGIGSLRAGLGYKLRTDHHQWPVETGGVLFGDEVPWAVDVTIRPKAFAPILDSGDRQEWDIGLHGALPAGPVAPFGLGDPGASMLSPVLLATGDRIALGHYRDTYLLLGGDFGIHGAAGVPSFRGVLSMGWAPRSHDRDGDGLADDIDECPDLPEDRDGIQDSDGCPEDDADGDGILDTEDACPLVAGAATGDPKTNGCPVQGGGPDHVAP